MKMISARRLVCKIALLAIITQATAQSAHDLKGRQRKASTSNALNNSQQSAQNFTVTAKVDSRVELMSIVARLAGYEEYVNNYFKLYAKDVDTYFEKYREHPAVQYARKIRQSNRIGYDAVMKMAVHLDSPPSLTPRVSFTSHVPDERWGREAAEKFSKLLQQFYRDADCASFFNSHAALYRTAEERFQQLLGKVDFGWYRRFYGEVPKGTFNLYLGLLNGGGNYGPKVVHPNGLEDIYAVIGTSKTDNEGLPVYDERTLATIIHEFNHSFINHLVHARRQQLRASGEKVYLAVADKMKNLAYGDWEITLTESLVRAAVIRYLQEHEAPEVVHRELIRERSRGFLWIDELNALLGTYENSHSSYPTFNSFFPLIESYYKDLGKRIDFKAKKFEELRPRVSHLAPFSNEAQDVDPSISQLTIIFDKPLDPKGGISIDLGPGGSDHNPLEKVVGFNETGSALTLQVKLKPDWEYGLVLTGAGFKTAEGYPLQPYAVKFRTRKQ